ncbi:macro-containing protein [Coleophoma crateriformis]|uniref:Macro-containing protein n=1 Tax=Coleophoma crateriformis TaxID=565419 RepID=A0A3D8S2A4_9HELO|nr:macro-containing protein [Coleophoma crateriformis]
MTIIPISEIPTIPLLYKLKKLTPAPPSSSSLPNPSQTLNDKIGLVRGDITTLEVDAIVNAANESLMGGGGVDGAIHRAAGPGLLKECKGLGGCDTGSAKITDAYRLPCNRVIHAVGPIWDRDWAERSEKDLRGCYTTSLQLAAENRCKSIAFSALSTGVYRYPSKDAAQVAIKAVKDFLEGGDGDKLNKVVFCTFADKDVAAYDEWLPKFFPPVESISDKTDKKPEKESGNDADKERDWEKIEGGDTAENGLATKNGAETGSSEETPKIDLPEVPKDEPAEEGPIAKKQKPN